MNHELFAAELAAKTILASLNPLRCQSDEKCLDRLQHELSIMIGKADGTKGFRPLKVRDHGSVLKRFNFHPKARLVDSFANGYKVEINEARNAATLHIPPFEQIRIRNRTEKATHFRLGLALVALSDLEYSEKAECHLPIEPAFQGLTAHSWTPYFPRFTPIKAPLEIQASLPLRTPLPPSAGLVTCVLLQFVSNFGTGETEFYEYANSRSIHIIKIA